MTTVSLDLIKRTIGDLYLENTALKERLQMLESQHIQRLMPVPPPADEAGDEAAGEASG